MANHGDGTVLKPKFNHHISKPDTSKPEIYRTEKYSKSKLGTIAKLEDMGAFDTDAKLERLRGIKR